MTTDYPPVRKRDPFRPEVVEALEMQLFECGQAVTPRYIVNTGPIFAGIQHYADVRLHDLETPSWQWNIRIAECEHMSDGWYTCRAEILGADGAPYGFPRPQLIYGRPWVHPSLLVWPDSIRGPLALTVRVPGNGQS